MRKFFVGAVALALLPALTWGQSTRPSIGLQGQGAQSGAAATIAQASTKNAAVRAVTANIWGRGPLSTDITGYTPGVSLWADQNYQFYQYTRLLNSTFAFWTPYASPGAYPGSVIPSAVAAYSSRIVVAGWPSASAVSGGVYGPLVVTRPTDGATWPSATSPGYLFDGSPNIPGLLNFLAPTTSMVGANGQPIGFCTERYDQTDNGAYDGGAGGNNETQTALVNAPRLDVSNLSYGRIGCGIDAIYRAYLRGAQNWPVTSYSGLVLTMTGGVPWFFQAGNTVTGTNIPASCSIASVQYSAGTITLGTGCTPTGTVGILSIGGGTNSGYVFWNIPTTLSVPWETLTALQMDQLGPQQSSAALIMLGQQATTANSSSNAYSGLYIPGISGGGGLRSPNGNSSNNSWGAGPYAHMAPQTVGYSMGGSSGRTVSYQINGQQGTYTGPTPTATNLTGGSEGWSQQYSSAFISDYLNFETLIYPSTLSFYQYNQITASNALAFNQRPQPGRFFACDGSSTTVGNGVANYADICSQIELAINSITPAVGYNCAKPVVIEQAIANYPIYCEPNLPSSQPPTLIWWPGEGNSLQTTTSATVTAQTGGALTITAAVVNTSFGIGTYVTGSCITGVSQVTAAPPSGTVITINPAPTGTCTTVTGINDSAAQVWATIQAYVAQAATANPGINIIFVGSASRKTFTTSNATQGSGTQVGEFGTLKVIEEALAPSLCNGLNCTIVGYVDLDRDPYFGGDTLGGMTVSSVTGSSVCVNTLSTYAANGNQVYWAGMPYSLTADTGVQTISGLSGTCFTLSGASTGLSVGGLIYARNPTPWTSYPAYWSTGIGGSQGGDGQHFTLAAYQIDAQYVANVLALKWGGFQ